MIFVHTRARHRRLHRRFYLLDRIWESDFWRVHECGLRDRCSRYADSCRQDRRRRRDRTLLIPDSRRKVKNLVRLRRIWSAQRWRRPTTPAHSHAQSTVAASLWSLSKFIYDLLRPNMSNPTAATSTPPFTTYCAQFSTLSRDMPLSRLARISAPKTAPKTVPRPPIKLVPPITHEAIASSSISVPASGD